METELTAFVLRERIFNWWRRRLAAVCSAMAAVAVQLPPVICSAEGKSPSTSKMLNSSALIWSAMRLMVALRVLVSWLVRLIWSSVKVAPTEVKRRESEDNEDDFEDLLASVRKS